MAKKNKKDKSDDFIKIEEKVKDIKEKSKEIIKEEEPIKKIDVPRGKVYKHPFVNLILILTSY